MSASRPVNVLIRAWVFFELVMSFSMSQRSRKYARLKIAVMT